MRRTTARPPHSPISLMLTALLLTGALTSTGCGALSGLLKPRAGGPSAAPTSRVTNLDRTKRALQTARAKGVPTDAASFEGASRAWHSVMKRATSDRRRYCAARRTSIDRNESCADHEAMLKQVRSERAAFLKRAAQTAFPMFVKWPGTLLVTEMKTGWHPDLPLSDLLTRVIETYTADMRAQTRRGLRKHVAETGAGVCTFHTKRPNKRAKTAARTATALFSTGSGQIHIRCTAAQRFANYRRSKPDFISVSFWNPEASAFEPTGYRVSVTAPRSDQIALTIPTRAIARRVVGQGGIAGGDRVYLRVRYIAAHITHRQKVWRRDREVIQDVWDLQTAAEGKLFLQTR